MYNYRYKEQANKPCCGGYKLILLDLNMPVMSGLKAAKYILDEFTKLTNINEVLRSESFGHALTPVRQKPTLVAVTAFASEEEREK